MRKSRAKKRILLPDPKFGDKLVTRFVNTMMMSGKKNLAFKIFYDAIEIVESNNFDENSLDVWKKALSNVMPQVEVRSRRIGGATFQIPMEIRPERKISMAMTWMIKFSRKRNEKSMKEKLASEIADAISNKGSAVKKREDTHKMAEANKAFAHYRW